MYRRVGCRERQYQFYRFNGPAFITPLGQQRAWPTAYVYSAVGGASLLLLADTLVQNIPGPQELQVGVITAALGVALSFCF